MLRIAADNPVRDRTYIYKVFQANTSEKIKKTAAESGTDLEKNRQFVEKYRKFAENPKALENGVIAVERKRKILKGLGFLLILAGVISVAGVISDVDNLYWNGWKAAGLHFLMLVLASACFYAGICVFIFIRHRVDKLLAQKKKELAQYSGKRKAAGQACYDSLESFLLEVDEFFILRLLEESLEGFSFKRYLDDRTQKEMESRSPGLFSHSDMCTVEDIINGSLFGNRFVIRKTRKLDMEDMKYYGSAEIDAGPEEGDAQKEREPIKEVVKASVDKQKPVFSEEIELLYVSDNAPDLSFSHNIETPPLSRRKKNIAKKHFLSVIKGLSGFTPMSNSEFEETFYAIDRDNEIQFRELFTPAAQLNHLTLIRELGDYYTLSKEKCLSTIRMKDGKCSCDLYTDPFEYRNRDFQKVREKIEKSSDTCFQGFFSFFCRSCRLPGITEKIRFRKTGMKIA